MEFEPKSPQPSSETKEPSQSETENTDETSQDSDTALQISREAEKRELTRRKFLELITVGLAGSSIDLGCAFHALTQGTKKRERHPSPEYRNPPEVIERGEYHFVGDHNWALYAWGKDVLEGKLPPRDNTIVHVDAHNDSGLEEERHFFLPKKLLEQWQDPEIDKDKKLQLLHEATKTTSIGKFITTAAMLGITDKMYWVRPRYQKPINKTRHFEFTKTITWEDADEIFFDVSELGAHGDKDIETLKKEGRKIFSIHEITADQILEKIQDDPSVIFDVDLDYLGSYEQGAPLRLSCEGDIDPLTEKLCKKYASEMDENKTILNPVAPYGHKPTQEEYQRDIAELQNISARLANKKIARTAALSPGFIDPDYADDMVQTFFNDGKHDQLPKHSNAH